MREYLQGLFVWHNGEHTPSGCSKWPSSKAAADGSTGSVTFSPAHPELLAQFCPDGLRWGCFRGENDARENARLGAPGQGGWEERLFQHPVRKIAAGYCEALPILVQQRPCAYMRFTVDVHFS
jgi:hypothetical protein